MQDITAAQWQAWQRPGARPSFGPIAFPHPFASDVFRNAAVQNRAGACFTCGECSSACPISGAAGVFDPRAIVRKAQLGLEEEILGTPAIWLCLDCGRCAEACSQGVDGRGLIRAFQEQALLCGRVDADLPARLERSGFLAYRRYLEAIDRLLAARGSEPIAPSRH